MYIYIYVYTICSAAKKRRPDIEPLTDVRSTTPQFTSRNSLPAQRCSST